jgi:hypothetical protein
VLSIGGVVTMPALIISILKQSVKETQARAQAGKGQGAALPQPGTSLTQTLTACTCVMMRSLSGLTRAMKGAIVRKNMAPSAW